MARILIAAGGTAGHVVPALAVADELRDRGAQVSFAGTAERAEAELVPAAGYEIDFLSVSGIDRSRPTSAIKAFANAAKALPAARRLLRRVDPDVVVGGGGYIAGPVGLAAASVRKPLVLTEADSHFGLANRMLAPLARRVCLAFPLAGRGGDKYLVTGRPVPRAVLDADPVAARERLGIDPQDRCLVIFGGSLGARSINLAAIEAFGADPPEGAAVVHVSGTRDHVELSQKLSELGNPGHYRLVEYLETLADPLAAADLVVARAGGSVFELAAAGCPAVLIPYPHASADHQARNAAWMQEGGAAVVISDNDLSADRLREQVAGLLVDVAGLAAMSAAATSLARPDAAARIASEILEAVR